MKRKVRRRKRTNIRHEGRAGICFRILALFVVCLMPFLLFRTAAAAEQEEQIVIMATSGEILQGEKLPQAGVRIYGMAMAGRFWTESPAIRSETCWMT